MAEHHCWTVPIPFCLCVYGNFLVCRPTISNRCTSQFDTILIVIAIKTRYKDKGHPWLTPLNEGTDPDAYLLLIIFQQVPLNINRTTRLVLEGVCKKIFYQKHISFGCFKFTRSNKKKIEILKPPLYLLIKQPSNYPETLMQSCDYARQREPVQMQCLQVVPTWISVSPEEETWRSLSVRRDCSWFMPQEVVTTCTTFMPDSLGPRLCTHCCLAFPL